MRLESITAQPAFGVAIANPDGSSRTRRSPDVTADPTGCATSSSTPIGERAIGEVLIGVLAGRRRQPSADGRRRHLHGRRRQRPDRARRAHQRLRPRRRSAVDHHPHRGCQDAVTRRRRAHARDVPPAADAADRTTRPSCRSRSPTASTTAAAAATTRVGDGHRRRRSRHPLRADRGRRPGRPGAARRGRHRRRARQRPRPRRPRAAGADAVRRHRSRRSCSPPTGMATITAGAADERASATRSPTRRPDGARRWSPSSSPTTWRPRTAPLEVETPAGTADHDRHQRPGRRSRRRRAVLHVLRRRRGGGTDHRRRDTPAALRRHLHARHRRSPGAGGFSYTVDDQHGHTVSGAVIVTVLAPANRPPAATDGTAEPRGRHGRAARPRPARHRPRRRHRRRADLRAARRADGRDARRLDASRSTPPIDAGGQTLPMPLPRHRQRRCHRGGNRHGQRHRPTSAAADRGGDVGAHHAGRAGRRRRLANDVDPARPGADRHRRRRAATAPAPHRSAATVDTVTFQPDRRLLRHGDAHVHGAGRPRAREAGQAVGQLTVDVDRPAGRAADAAGHRPATPRPP